MSSGFDVDFDMSSDEISTLLKKYKKIKKYQKSNLFTIKTIDGTENYVSKMVEEAQKEGF
jgi:hypothetical protein